VRAPRNVAVLSPSGDLAGGAEISLVEMLRLLAGSPRMTLILPAEGTLAAAARDAGVDVLTVPVPQSLTRAGEASRKRPWAGALFALPALLIFVRRLSRELRGRQFDLLLTNGMKSHVAGTLAAASVGIPVVWHLRDSLEARPLSKRLLGMLAGRCSGAIAISRYVARQLDGGRFGRIPTSIVYNPVDLDRFSPSSDAAPDLRKPASEIWFASIGALTQLKGHDLFLQAAESISGKVPGARFFVVGENRYPSERDSTVPSDLERMAGSGALRGRVRFLGNRSDVSQVIASMDVIVQSNRGPEALGRVVLEAMASGKAVVAFDHGGPGEILQSGVTGMLVPWKDLDALGAAMRRLAADPGLRSSLGTNARQWIELHLDPRELVSAFRAALAGAAQ
jgi:glycosyltransferase involved in cell wall biosynthesis